MKSKLRGFFYAVLAFAAMTSAPWSARPAFASPSASFSGPTIVGATTFNTTQQAICSGSTITVQVTVTPTYDSSGTCLNLGGSPPVRRTATGSGTVSVTANGTTLTCASNVTGGLCSGTISVGSEGINTVSIVANLTDGNTTTSCSGGTSPTASPTASTKYALDEQAPTLTIQAYSPAPTGTPALPTINAGDSLTVQTQLTDGSSGTQFTLKFSGYMDSTTIGPFSDTDNFTGPSGNNDDGIAPTNNNTIALKTACDTPGGTYTAKVEADTKNLCGGDYAAIIADPAKTHGGDSGNDTSGTFRVVGAPPPLHDQTLVLSEFPTGDYGIDQCFTNQLQSHPSKVVNDPGTVHIASIITATPPSCADTTPSNTFSNTMITLDLPSGFAWYRTGNSPLAHVFVGQPSTPPPGFDLHSGYPLTEVTSSAQINQVSLTEATVDLSSVDVGLGPGVIPDDDVVFVRAHAIWALSTPAGPDGTYTFTDSVTATIGSQSYDASSSVDITSNPTCVNSGFLCVDGLENATACNP